VRVLSVTCCTNGCKINGCISDQVHTKRKNRLRKNKFNAFVFVRNNLQFGMRQKVREEKKDTCDPICLSNIESNNEWITKKLDPFLQNDVSWMDIHESLLFKRELQARKGRVIFG